MIAVTIFIYSYFHVYSINCAKAMQTNFNEFPCFWMKYRSKRKCGDISPHFRDGYCFNPCEFSSANLHCLKKRSQFWSDDLLGSKYLNKLLSDNSLCLDVRWEFFPRTFLLFSSSGIFDGSHFRCVVLA